MRLVAQIQSEAFSFEIAAADHEQTDRDWDAITKNAEIFMHRDVGALVVLGRSTLQLLPIAA